MKPFSVRLSLAWMTISQAAMFVLQFGGSLVVARWLTPYDMGIFAVAISVVGLLSVLRAFGLSSYVVRASSLDDGTLSSVFTINTFMLLTLSAMIAACSFAGEAFLNEPGVQRVLLVLALIPLIGIFEFLPAAVVERSGDFRTISIVNLARSFTSTLIMLVSVFLGASYMSLAYGQVGGAVTAMIAFNLTRHRQLRPRVGLAGWPDIMRYGLHMFAISGVNVLFGRTAEILLGRLLGLEALGLYSRASGLNGLLWETIHSVITRIVFVDFAAQHRAGISLRDAYMRVLQMITALLWPAFVGISVISGPLILTLYGPAWVEAAIPLSLISISAAVLVSITMTWEVFVVCQETGRQARFEFIRAGVGFALFAAGCALGLIWAAAARVVEALFSFWLYRPHLGRMTHTSQKDFIPIYRDSLALTVVAAAPAFAVMTWYDWAPQAPFPAVLAAVVAGMAAWCILLVAIRHPLAQEGRRLISRLLYRRG